MKDWCCCEERERGKGKEGGREDVGEGGKKEQEEIYTSLLILVLNTFSYLILSSRSVCLFLGPSSAQVDTLITTKPIDCLCQCVLVCVNEC